jgi:GT2 family glycosyltransferase
LKISVVILNYNVCYFLEQCVRSVEKALVGLDAEVIVVDNASADQSVAMIKKTFPEVILVANDTNTGFSKGNNLGVARARGEYICLLNPDTAVSQELFRECLEFAKQRKDLGVLGARLIDGTGSFLPESKRNIPTPSAAMNKLLGISRGGKGYYEQQLKPTETGPVPILPGAFLFLKRSVYQEVGGLDEAYFMYGEDIDLCYKVLKEGYQNYYLGSQVVLHYKGESTQRDRTYYERFYGAMKIFYSKHFGGNHLKRSLVNLVVSLVKVFKQKDNSLAIPLPEPTEVVLITDNFQLLQVISKLFDLPVRSASKVIFDQERFGNALIIFDEAYISYGQIFSVMQRLKNLNNRFRIRPARCNYFIGSDRSDEKGSVVHF